MSIFNNSTTPCNICPYKLGLIKTLVNPCPNCKMNGYSAYKQFEKQIEKKSDR